MAIVKIKLDRHVKHLPYHSKCPINMYVFLKGSHLSLESSITDYTKIKDFKYLHI